MVSVDKHTQVVIEIVAQSVKSSEQTLLRILQALTKLLEGNEQQPKDFILDAKTKVGKQKISDLMKKHEKTRGGIVTLDKNLTKQQLNDYQKELKKLGVDFSVVQNGKEEVKTPEKVNDVYNEMTTVEKKKPKREQILNAKLEELDEIKKGLYSQEINCVEKLFENRYKQDGEKDTNKEKTEVEIHAKDDKEGSVAKFFELN